MITGDKEFQKTLKNIERKVIPAAHNSATNKITKRISTRAISGVSKSTKIKSSVIRKRVTISKSSINKPGAKLTFYKRAVQAVQLVGAGTLTAKSGSGTNRRGVRAAGRQFNGAFINVLRKNGRYQVLRRTGKRKSVTRTRNGRRVQVSDETLEVVKIPIEKAVDATVHKAAERVIDSDYQKLLTHEIRYRLSKYGTVK